MNAARVLPHKWILDIEDQLAKVYRLPLVTSAVPFLMNAEQLVQTDKTHKGPRASVFLTQSPDETLDIGIFIAPELFGILEQHDPLVELNAANLDAYLVLIEELSHFHLLLHRAEEDRGVSQLELEWQGEIDKLLLAGLLMSEQKNKSCFKDLHRILFEESTLTSSDPVYQEASHYAAKCWHRFLTKSHRPSDIYEEFLPQLQSAYKADWGHKFRLIHGR